MSGLLRLIESGERAATFEAGPNEVLLGIDRDVLGFLKSAVGEALEAVEEWEFQTRLGKTPEEAWVVLRRINELLAETYRPE